MLLSDKEIENLINIEKIVTISPNKQFKEDKFLFKRNKFNLSSKDGKNDFFVYTRQSTDFIDDFSIGLLYLPKDSENITILRYNGLHGVHKNPDNSKLTGVCHIHKATQYCIDNNIKTEKHADITNKYSTFEEALKVFWYDINIKENIKKYFLIYQDIQKGLFEDDELG